MNPTKPSSGSTDDNGVQDVRERFRASAVSDHPHEPPAGVSITVLEAVAAGLLPAARRVTLLRRLALKSESGRSDPPWPREQRRPKEANMTGSNPMLAKAPWGVRGSSRLSRHAQTIRDLRLFKV